MIDKITKLIDELTGKLDNMVDLDVKTYNKALDILRNKGINSKDVETLPQNIQDLFKEYSEKLEKI